jgi:hypothetical protein
VNKALDCNSLSRRFLLACLVLPALILTTGCTMSIPMSPKIGELVLLKPIPIEVALLVTDETHNYVYRSRPSSFAGSATPFEFPLGQALETVSMDAFSQVFQKVVLVRTLTEARRYPVYIEPSIDEFDFHYEPFDSSPLVVKLAARVVLMDAGSKVWERVESSQIRGLRSGNHRQLWGDAANESLVTCVKKIAMAMSENPAIRKLGAPTT